MTDAHELRSRTRRGLRMLAIVLVGAVLLAELGVQIVLNAGLIPARIISRHTTVGWDHAWSVWPTHIHVTGFWLQRREEFGIWRLDVDEAVVDLDLLALRSHDFITRHLDVRGVSLHIEPDEIPPEVTARRRKPRNPRRKWAFLLHDVTLHDLRTLAVREFEIASPLEGRGAFEVTHERTLTLENVRLYLHDGVVSGQGTSRGTLDWLELSANGSGTAGPGKNAGLALLQGLSGTIDLAARWDTLDWLGLLTTNDPDVLHGGAGRLTGRLQVVDGALAEGSHLDADGDSVSLHVGPVTFRGPYAWAVTAPAGNRPTHLQARLSGLEIGLDGARHGTPLFTALPALDIGLDALGRGVIDLFGRFDVSLRMPPVALVPFAGLVPFPKETFAVTGGSGSLVLKLRVPVAAGDEAQLHVVGRDLVARWAGTPFTGRLAVRASARVFEHHGEESLRGSGEVTLSDVRLQWPELREIPIAGTLSLRNVVARRDGQRVDGRLEGSLSNAVPLVALLEGTGKLPGILEPLLGLGSLQLSARLRADSEGLTLDDLLMRSGATEVRGRITTREGGAQALLLVSIHGRAVGADVGPQGTHVHLWRPEAWFHEKLGVPMD